MRGCIDASVVPVARGGARTAEVSASEWHEMLNILDEGGDREEDN